uniref:G-protein coupled receptors family 2 profile 1 domain-containing protein n=1 Tax=Magallana gigas TaxID=29159 RepID=K1P5V0_MAGGI
MGYTKSIRSVITGKDTGKCKYIKIKQSYVYKLSDFGTAKPLKDGDFFQSLVGTEEYLHPDIFKAASIERHRPREFDISVDLFQMISHKDPGVISGEQTSATGDIIWSKELPKTCRLSKAILDLYGPNTQRARICHLTHRVGRGVCDLSNGLLVLSDHSMDCDVMWTMCGREGVFPGPLYSVKLSYKKQLQLLQKARERCLQEHIVPRPAVSGPYCNQTFDNIVCWPDTMAGTMAEQNCPNYINNFDTRAKARRECLPNGQWYVHPGFNKTWTDFRDCLDKRKPVDPLMVDLSNNYVFHTPEGRPAVINNTATLTTEGSNWTCKLVFTFFNYIIVANYLWIFIEGLYLHNLIFITTFKKSKRKLARSTLVLIPLFGVYYMISVVMPECMDPGVELIWLYVESGVNSFQVQQEIRKKWNRKWKLRRLSTVSSRSTRTMSVGSAVCIKDKQLSALILAGNVLQNKSGKWKQNVPMELQDLNQSPHRDIHECASDETLQESNGLFTSQ